MYSPIKDGRKVRATRQKRKRRREGVRENIKKTHVEREHVRYGRESYDIGTNWPPTTGTSVTGPAGGPREDQRGTTGYKCVMPGRSTAAGPTGDNGRQVRRARSRASHMYYQKIIENSLPYSLLGD